MRKKSNVRRKTYKNRYQKSRKKRYQKKSKRRSKRMRGGAAAGGGESAMKIDLNDGGAGVKAVAAAKEAREKEQYYEALATLAHLSKGGFLTKSDHDKIKVENTLEGIERVLLEVLEQIHLRQNMGKGFDYDAALQYFKAEKYSEKYLLHIMKIMQKDGKGPF
jgi:hypothetical protein